MDFQFVPTADGRRLKFLNVIDEHSRLCLAIRVGRRWRNSPASTVYSAPRSSAARTAIKSMLCRRSLNRPVYGRQATETVICKSDDNFINESQKAINPANHCT